MYIEELSLRNFRNYNNLNLTFTSGINIITGSNAIGKTNIIEAITITSGVRSFRNVQDMEIIKWGENSYYCCSNIKQHEFQKFEVGCVNLSNKIIKKVKIDGIFKNKMQDFYGKFLTAIIVPEDINIINGSPEKRRRFFDSMISKLSSKYLTYISELKKILAQRNSVLRKIRQKRDKNLSELEIWDKLFSEKASFILEKRKEILEKFIVLFRDVSKSMSCDADCPEIKYEQSLESDDPSEIIDILKKNRNNDILRCSTGKGPHRDDYCFLNERLVHYKNFASQGQKRTAAVSLKIAECGLLNRENSSNAVLLVDDIFSELDENRRNSLMEEIINKGQVIITAANSSILRLDKFDNVERFFVRPGGIVDRI